MTEQLYSIKPLVWEPCKIGYIIFRAILPDRSYEIVADPIHGRGGYRRGVKSQWFPDAHSVEEAKAACQSDYEARLMAALEPCDCQPECHSDRARGNKAQAEAASVALAEVTDLMEHAMVHSGYSNCGYMKMTTEQQAVYDKLLETLGDDSDDSDGPEALEGE